MFLAWLWMQVARLVYRKSVFLEAIRETRDILSFRKRSTLKIGPFKFLPEFRLCKAQRGVANGVFYL